MNDRKCLECFEQLKGRTDQKFCSDQCRSSYNNRQYVESNTAIRTVNRILKKNYSILTSLTSEGKSNVTKSDLQRKGYRFDYFTYTCTARNSRLNFYCYDHGFREQENNKLILLRRELNEDMSGPRA